MNNDDEVGFRLYRENNRYSGRRLCCQYDRKVRRRLSCQ